VAASINSLAFADPEITFPFMAFFSGYMETVEKTAGCMSSRFRTDVFTSFDAVSAVLLWSARFSLKTVMGEEGSKEIVSSPKLILTAFPAAVGGSFLLLCLNGLFIGILASEFERTCFYGDVSVSDGKTSPCATSGVITETYVHFLVWARVSTDDVLLSFFSSFYF